MKKVTRIIALLLSVILLLSGISILSGCSNKEKEFEEALVVELERRIEEFTQGNPADNVEYEITSIEIDGYYAYIRVVYNIETTQKPEMYGNYKYYSSHNYDLLLDSIHLESVEMSAEIYGSSNSSSKKCSVCGKSYSSGGSSNMCSQCYKNYKYAADAAGY